MSSTSIDDHWTCVLGEETLLHGGLLAITLHLINCFVSTYIKHQGCFMASKPEKFFVCLFVIVIVK